MNYFIDVEILKPVERKGETWKPGQRLTITRPLALELQKKGKLRPVIKGITTAPPIKKDEQGDEEE